MRDDTLIVIGAPQLDVQTLLRPLEAELRQGYTVEWHPGVPAQAPYLWLKWLWWADRGAWLVLPSLAEGRTLATTLAARLERTLEVWEAQWFEEHHGARVARCQVSKDGTSRVETVDHYDEAEPEQAILIGMGLMDVAPALEHDLRLYPKGAGGTSADGPAIETAPAVAVDDKRLQKVRALIERAAGWKLVREGADTYLFSAQARGDVLTELEGDTGVSYAPDELTHVNIYLNAASAAALRDDAPATAPSLHRALWGPLPEGP